MSSNMILISGKQGSGKTTVQHLLLKEIFENTKYVPIAANFADPLYKMHNFCRGVLKESGVPFDDSKKDGRLLQLLGTEWGRENISEDIWVSCMKNYVSSEEEKYSKLDLTPVFVVGDCRFENEFNAFKNAFRVRLKCPEEKRKYRCSSWRDATTHPSETSLDLYDEMGLFDVVYDSYVLKAEIISNSIIEMFREKNWLLGRERY